MTGNYTEAIKDGGLLPFQARNIYSSWKEMHPGFEIFGKNKLKTKNYVLHVFDDKGHPGFTIQN